MRAAGVAGWQEAIPDADVRLTDRLIGPIAALRMALIYRGFLDHVEQSERVYHHHDPAIWLRKAIALAHR